MDHSGSLSVEEFMSLPELQQNPLVQRVIEIFDQDGNGEVDFKGMISADLYNLGDKICLQLVLQFLSSLSQSGLSISMLYIIVSEVHQVVKAFKWRKNAGLARLYVNNGIKSIKDSIVNNSI